MPENAITTELSAIIVSSDAIDTIHWKQLK